MVDDDLNLHHFDQRNVLVTLVVLVVHPSRGRRSQIAYVVIAYFVVMSVLSEHSFAILLLEKAFLSNVPHYRVLDRFCDDEFYNWTHYCGHLSKILMRLILYIDIHTLQC